MSDCASLSSGDIRNITSLDTLEPSAPSGESPRTGFDIEVLCVAGPRCGDNGESALDPCAALSLWVRARAEVSAGIAMGSEAAWASNVILSPPVFCRVADGRGRSGDIGCHPLSV